MTFEQQARFNLVAANLGALHDLMIKLAQGNEGCEGDDLLLAGTFYSLANSVEREKDSLDAAIEASKTAVET